MLDGIFVKDREYIGFNHNGLIVENHITFVDATSHKIFVSTVNARSYLFGFKNTVCHVHVEIEHYGLATLFFGFAKGRFNSVFAFHTFSVTKFLVDGVLRVFMAKN